MCQQRSPVAAACLVMVLVTQSFLLAVEKQQSDVPERGTDLGNYVPTTTTWVVLSPTLSKYNGRNTCLAGVYRKEKTISIYAQTEEKNVWDFLHAIDRTLKDHPEIKAYIVINKSLRDNRGSNVSGQRFRETQELAKTHDFKHLDVSLCRSPSKFLFNENTLVKFVYSEQRIVKLSKKFPKTDQALKELPALIAEVVKLAAAK